MKTEIGVIKKTQTKGILDMENLGKWTGTIETSITNRIEEIEGRISVTEDTIEEIDSLVKENIKSNKFLTQNIQEIWDTMKRTNLRIIGIEEGEEIQLKGTENIFNKIIEENFPNLKNLWRYKKITDHQIDSIKKQKTNKFNLTYDNQSTKHTE